MRSVTLPTVENPAEHHLEWLAGAVDAAEASLLTGRSKSALATLRCRGGGPPFIKAGKCVRYIRRDLLEWLYEHRVRNTSESR
jgi:hypothetical protein